MAQRREHKPQVNVRPGPTAQQGKMRAEKRHVELAAVERDQKRKLGDVGGKLVEVDALDEQRKLAAAQGADHRHRVMLGRQAGRLDVQEKRALGELGIKPPRFPRGQPVLKKSNVARGQGVQRATHHGHARLASAGPKASRFGRREEAGPIEYALLP